MNRNSFQSMLHSDQGPHPGSRELTIRRWRGGLSLRIADLRGQLAALGQRAIRSLFDPSSPLRDMDTLVHGKLYRWDYCSRIVWEHPYAPKRRPPAADETQTIVKTVMLLIFDPA